MDQGVFFSLLKNSPDRQTVENYCQAFPEYCWKETSIYWLNLIRERYGEEKIPNFKDLYLKLVEKEIRPTLQINRIRNEGILLKIFIKFQHRDFFLARIDPQVKQDFENAMKWLMRCSKGFTIGVNYSNDSFMVYHGGGNKSKISEAHLHELLSLIPAKNQREC